jgi:flagellar basal body-associated protein FliL
MSEAPIEPQKRRQRDWLVIIVAVVILLVIAAVVVWALFGAVRQTPSENAASASAYVRSSVNLIV